MSREIRTARLTVLVDPDKKALFEELCRRDDLTPSQVVRQLIRTYIEEKLGRPWKPGDESTLPSTLQQQNSRLTKTSPNKR